MMRTTTTTPARTTTGIGASLRRLLREPARAAAPHAPHSRTEALALGYGCGPRVPTTQVR